MSTLPSSVLPVRPAASTAPRDQTISDVLLIGAPPYPSAAAAHPLSSFQPADPFETVSSRETLCRC
jgi:hypothetical protein